MNVLSSMVSRKYGKTIKSRYTIVIFIIAIDYGYRGIILGRGVLATLSFQHPL